MEARRVIFVNRYFHPDHSATSQMLTDLAFFLAGRGWQVSVVTSRQRYDDPGSELPARESVRGVSIHRVATTRFGRALLPGRAIDYLTFYVSAFLALFLMIRRKSLVVAKTDPPLISAVAALATRLRGGTLVNWVQDLFPDVAVALGVMRSGSLTTRLANRLRDAALRRARTNVALGDLMAEAIRARGARVVVQHNWADSSLVPVARDANSLRAEWGLGDHFVAGYSGNLGRAHEFATLLGAMRQLAGDPRVRFLIIGAGAHLAELREKTAGLGNVRFQPYQPRETLGMSLSVPDVHLISLQPALEGLIVPSKLYGILAVARPAIHIGASEGEVGRILLANDCGMVVAPGDTTGLARAITMLASDPGRAAAMGARGQSLFETAYGADVALPRWESILSEAADG
ncbi:MAG TPA: glycosyltransferase family 4 protein [Thermoanaerobaculia bacterium]|nr:glycosyltransferase family 4 protein [Thermoanaerobaculia bacterium]